jgi:hypothetical protein
MSITGAPNLLFLYRRYIASFVADLSTYDVLTGNINKTLAFGFTCTGLAGTSAVVS